MPTSNRQTIWNYLLTVVVSAAIGAGLTWMFMTLSRPYSRSELRPFVSAEAAMMAEGGPNVSGMSARDAKLTLGNFAYDHQRWSDAARYYQDAIAAGADNADVHTDLGNAFRFSGQPEQALNQYTIAQKLNPQHENSLFNQISLFIESLNQPQRAIPICEEFIRRFPNSDKVPAVREQLERAKSTKR